MSNERLEKFDPLNKWEQNGPKQGLLEMYNEVVKVCDVKIRWYEKYKHRNAVWAQIIRVASIALLVTSTLVPYFAALNDNNSDLLYWGYVLAGVGGGLLLFDKYYGFSSSWVRFTLTSYDLENARNTFIKNWQILYLSNQPLTLEKYVLLANSIIEFQQILYGIVKTETSQWAKEFQQNFNDLIAALNSQAEVIKKQIAEERQKTQELNSNYEISEMDVPNRVILEAIDQNYGEWKSRFQILGVGVGKKKIQKESTLINSLVFTVATKLDLHDTVFNEIPHQIKFKSIDGRIYNIPTDVLESGSLIQALAGPALLCDNLTVKRPGCSISRKSGSKTTGTLSIKVFKGAQPYIVSCYHVLCSVELNVGIKEFSFDTSMGDTIVVSPGVLDSTTGVPIAHVVGGVLSDELDCALAEILDPESVSSLLCQRDHEPASILKITDVHEKSHYSLISIGRTSGIIKGGVQLHSTWCDVNYKIGGKLETITMKGMICTDQLSEEGDSGSPVFDENNNLIGIIIAASRTLTYILPIQRILKKFSVSLKPDVS